MPTDPLAGTPLDIRPNLDEAPWEDLAARLVGHGTLDRIGLLPNGATEGQPSVGLVVRLEGGALVLAQTTWLLLHTAVNALAASPVAERARRG